jgi:hypothetical protein
VFAQFIDEKGPRALSIIFGLPIQTIYSWRRRNLIPRRRWDRLIEAYPHLSYKRLREIEAASRSDVAA